jgi:calcium channel MID1
LSFSPASFACPLVHSLPYCPSISYAVPLSAPPSPSPAHDATTLPSALVDPLLKYLTNFTVTLTTFPCGRKDEVYSPLKTCADCQRAYRKWLCTVSFPRCTERSPINDGSTQGGAQAPLAPAHTTVPAAHPPRNTHLPPFPSAYTALLPCLETCTAVDRACPSFLRFRCPSVRFNANESYGLGYIDGRNGKMGAGSVGAWMNRWGNVWCNGS